ncbi:MAG: hypothetical protein RR340_03415, partial [Cloacibacillus sp.]
TQDKIKSDFKTISARWRKDYDEKSAVALEVEGDKRRAEKRTQEPLEIPQYIKQSKALRLHPYSSPPQRSMELQAAKE